MKGAMTTTQFISIVMGLFSDGTLTIGPVLLVVFWLISTDSIMFL